MKFLFVKISEFGFLLCDWSIYLTKIHFLICHDLCSQSIAEPVIGNTASQSALQPVPCDDFQRQFVSQKPRKLLSIKKEPGGESNSGFGNPQNFLLFKPRKRLSIKKEPGGESNSAFRIGKMVYILFYSVHKCILFTVYNTDIYQSGLCYLWDKCSVFVIYSQMFTVPRHFI